VSPSQLRPISTLAPLVLAWACVRLPPASVEPEPAPETTPVFVETEPDTAAAPANAPVERPPPTDDVDHRERAKQLYEEGLRAYRAADYATALARFREAYEYAPLPALRYNIAHTHEQLGDRRQACAGYLEVIATTPATDATRQSSEARVRALGC
jgi:TolA-binding protein